MTGIPAHIYGLRYGQVLQHRSIGAKVMTIYQSAASGWWYCWVLRGLAPNTVWVNEDDNGWARVLE